MTIYCGHNELVAGVQWKSTMGHCVCSSSNSFNQPYWRVQFNFEESKHVLAEHTGVYALEIYWSLIHLRDCLLLYILSLLFIVLKVLEDCPGDLNFWYRHISKGAWPFSTADHGWPISDCTAEGLKVSSSEIRDFSFLCFLNILSSSRLFFYYQKYPQKSLENR